MEQTLKIKELFTEALMQTVSNYAETSSGHITAFILHVCGELRPYMIVTPGGAETLAEEIFTNELKRDFIFNLLFNFCPRLSFTDVGKEFSKLISTLAFTLAIGDAVTASTDNESTSLLPEELSTRIPDHETITNLLNSNKWLVMVLLISLYINVDDFNKTTPKQ